MVFDHVDQVTGVHHIFCGYGSAARLIKGTYNTTTGLIDWDTTPELGGSRRMLSAGKCNGFLYACIGTDDDPTNLDGGVFWREDGEQPQWHLVHEFEGNSEDFHEDMRRIRKRISSNEEEEEHPHHIRYVDEAVVVGIGGVGTGQRHFAKKSVPSP